MERREAPAGLRDPLWRSLAIGPHREPGEASHPLLSGGGASRRSTNRCQACPVSASIHDALSSAAPGSSGDVS
jgi:hypothetical protein